MLLCVDVGNTQIALGLYPDPVDDSEPRPALVRDWRMRTDPRMTADELEVAVGAMLGRHAGSITGVAALSTVPSLLRELRLLREALEAAEEGLRRTPDAVLADWATVVEQELVAAGKERC